MPTSSRPPAALPDTSLPHTFVFGEFEFDEGRWELRKAGAAVDVPPKVMQTIGMLIRNRERVVTSEELLETLWLDVTVTEASLLKSIRLARKVLGDDGDTQGFIRTTRGRGYRFVAEITAVRPSGSALSVPPIAPTLAMRAPLFVGREAELIELSRALDGAFEAEGSFLLISGESGTGKTRLVNAFGRQATSRGARFVLGRATEDGGAPELWPWIQILRSLAPKARDATWKEVERVIGQRDQSPESESWELFQSDAARFRFFDAVSTLVREHSEREPLVIVLEDLHGADAASIGLLRFLARELSEVRVLLIGTFRPDPPAGSSDPFGRLIREARILKLSGLVASDTAALLSSHLGAPADRAFVDRVQRVTEGNPLFIEEIARHLLSSGAPADPEGLRIPERVAEIIRGRLEALDDQVRELLSVAAVIGREFDLALLERASRLGRNEVFLRLEPALARRIVIPSSGPSGECRFAHTLLREVLYDGMTLATRAEVHGRVADALTQWALAGEDLPMALLSYHHRLAAPSGRSELAARYARRAGDEALCACAYEDAARHYQHALDALIPDAQHDERCDILIACGHAERLSGDFSRASVLFRKAIELSQVMSDPIRKARAALGVAAVRPETGVVNHELIALLEDVAMSLEEIREEPTSVGCELEAMILARLSTCASLAGRAERGDALGKRALDLSRTSGKPLSVARALQARHWGSLWKPGAALERLAMAEEMIALARAGGDVLLGGDGRICELTDLLELGRREAFDRVVLEYAEDARMHRDASALCNARVFETTTAMLEGRFEDAERCAGEALTMGMRLSEGSARNYYAAALFWIRIEQGRAQEIEGLFRAGVETDPGNPLLLSALARVHAEMGEEALARSELAAFVQHRLGNLSEDWTTLPTLTHLAATCERLGDASSARLVEERLSPHAACHVVLGPAIVYLGPATLPLGLCALARSGFDDAIARFERAGEDGKKLRAAPVIARADCHLAEALARRAMPGDGARIATLSASALETARRLGMGSLAARARSLLENLE